ncbi:unnamed protein product [Anisakis simplex]|uniref:Uncharacterized protein n=1 Tax=Anisakis simplex TaxID=6269 RepID=A0A0M3JNQ8_ANISI|nr:unnamed protein product [Anisakis simplex]
MVRRKNRSVVMTTIQRQNQSQPYSKRFKRREPLRHFWQQIRINMRRRVRQRRHRN